MSFIERDVQKMDQDKGAGVLLLGRQKLVPVAETMAPGDQFDRVIAGAIALRESRVGEERRADHRRAGPIGVGLDGDLEPLRLGVADEHGGPLDVQQARAVEMADVHVRAGRSGETDQARIGID
jgi:hypothetical protein